MLPLITSCLICGTALTRLQRVGKVRFCGEACRWKYENLLPHQVCGVCGVMLLPVAYGRRLCDAPECWRVEEERARERERERREGLREETERLRDSAGEALGIVEPETYWPTVAPSYRGRISALPEERRQAFREVVARLAKEAAGASVASVGQRPGRTVSRAVGAVSRQACGLCRGVCCGTAGIRAYLRVETIRKFMKLLPDQSQEEVVEAYLGFVRAETYEGSCVYHAEGGCSLPREMRSDTCNGFYCTGLTEFQDAMEGREQVRAFLAQPEGETLAGRGFCDGETGELVRVDRGREGLDENTR